MPAKYKNIFLLLASCYFYMAWKAEYIVIMLGEAVINYAGALHIEKASSQKRKKAYLAACLLINFGILFVFKYLNFFNDTVYRFFNSINIMYNYPQFKLLLPIGISFYTFQISSYVMDVYRGKVGAEKNLMTLTLFKMFFPQLVAGPIERAGHLLPQFKKEHSFSYSGAIDGLKMMLWGFFKKLVIADRLAVLVNTVYNNPSQYNGLGLMIATVFFAFQIYCDFSGYSDIAVGSAKMLGFNLINNFNTPYFSRSIAEFWKRWHISLSSWFKEYLYISLGGNRVGKARWYFNLFFTFLVSGLWHGANWTYVAWGALNGFYLIFAIWTEKARESAEKMLGLNRIEFVYKVYKTAVTFFLTCLAWVFFRSNNIKDAFYVLKNMFTGRDTMLLVNIFLSNSKHALVQNIYKLKAYIEGMGLSQNEFFIAIAAILFMECLHFIIRKGESLEMLKKRPVWFRWGVYYVLVLSILNLSMGENSPFIYFRF
jgi:D-alanyl-lipoteichoic acid acyltransferase DltB (MBOAT superfamily)